MPAGNAARAAILRADGPGPGSAHPSAHGRNRAAESEARKMSRARGPVWRAVLCVCAGLALWATLEASGGAQQAAPILTIDEDSTAFAFGPGDHIAFSTRHVFGQQHFDLE